MSTFPINQIGSFNVSAPQLGGAIEFKVPVVDAAGANIDLTSGSAPGPYTVAFSIDPVDPTDLTDVAAPGTAVANVGFIACTLTSAQLAALRKGTHNARASFTGVDTVVRQAANGQLRIS